MPNLSVLLQSTISITDITLTPSQTIVTRQQNNPTLSSTVTFYDPFIQVPNGTVTVTLPAATVFVVYVKNLSNANNITVNFTPTGGVSQTLVLIPGGIFLYFLPSTGVGGGITALSLTGTAVTSVEVLVAG